MSLVPKAHTQSDTTEPTLVGYAVEAWILWLEYDEEIDSGSTPAATDFQVRVTPRGGSAEERTVDYVEVHSDHVFLHLASPVAVMDAVMLSYFGPEDGSSPAIQDAAGNEAATFTGLSVANNTAHVRHLPERPHLLAQHPRPGVDL